MHRNVYSKDPVTGQIAKVEVPQRAWRLPTGVVQVLDAGVGAPADAVELSDAEAAAEQALAVLPAVVSMRQARLALLSAGRYGDVAIAIAALPSPAKEAAQIEWEYATEVRRDSPLVTMLAESLSLDAAALDNLFASAAAL
jgi:hypothetical protein